MVGSPLALKPNEYTNKAALHWNVEGWVSILGCNPQEDAVYSNTLERARAEGIASLRRSMVFSYTRMSTPTIDSQ